MLDVLPDDRALKALTIVVLEWYQVEIDNLVASCVVCVTLLLGMWYGNVTCSVAYDASGTASARQHQHVTNVFACAYDAHTHTQLFYGPYSRITRVSRCQKKKSSGLHGARADIRGRHTDNPDGRHSIWTNQRPTSLIPRFLCWMPFLSQPSQFIVAWDRHQICWLACPVVWLYAYHTAVILLVGNRRYQYWMLGIGRYWGY